MESDYVNELSELLRRYRQEYNLSVAELAARLSISRDCLSSLERGTTLPTLPTLRSMMRVFESMSVEDLGALILSLPEKPRGYYAKDPDGE